MIQFHTRRIETLRNQSSSKYHYVSESLAMMIAIINGMRAFVAGSKPLSIKYFSDAVAIEEKLIHDTNTPTLLFIRAAEFLGLHLQLIYDSQSSNSVIRTRI